MSALRSSDRQTEPCEAEAAWQRFVIVWGSVGKVLAKACAAKMLPVAVGNEPTSGCRWDGGAQLGGASPGGQFSAAVPLRMEHSEWWIFRRLSGWSGDELLTVAAALGLQLMPANVLLGTRASRALRRGPVVRWPGDPASINRVRGGEHTICRLSFPRFEP
ncbi:hypothetical protein ACWD6K_26935 [Streptomyces sp. NPDC002431]